MNNLRRNTTPHPGANHPPQEDGHLHFRLCHICLHLNEADEEITECSECQHVFKDEILSQFFANKDEEAFGDVRSEDSPEPAQDDEESESVKPIRDLNGFVVRF